LSVRNRLARLEAAARTTRPQGGLRELTDEDRLAIYEAWGRKGCFAREPDFPVALAFYRDALRQAEAQADPPFDPPADFHADVT
jgi:hypothetical protein